MDYIKGGGVSEFGEKLCSNMQKSKEFRCEKIFTLYPIFVFFYLSFEKSKKLSPGIKSLAW